MRPCRFQGRAPDRRPAFIGAWSSCVAIAAVSMVISACAFVRLHRDLEAMRPFATLRGTAIHATESEAPIAVLLLEAPPAEPHVVDAFVLPRPGAFFFVAPPGRYRVVAFRDLDGDFVYRPGTEPAALYGAPTDVEVAAGAEITGLDLVVPDEATAVLDSPAVVPEVGRSGIHALPDKNVGTLAGIDDPRFTSASAAIGLWEPLRFLFEVGAGVYFLEPYDPEKTPVLFVHGILGEPRNFEYLVSQLDRTRFQPWMLYYPSGLRLELVARYALRWLKALAVQHGVEHLVIVAHSMGGLVAQALIEKNFADPDRPVLDGLDLFVSIATPWSGHRAAELGVTKAPVVVPSWNDMAPSSEFLRSLFARPAPDLDYYLLFAFRGRRLAREANDGTVTLSSQLEQRAQQAAVKIYGYDETHVSVLESAVVAAQLNRILAAEEARR